MLSEDEVQRAWQAYWDDVEGADLALEVLFRHYSHRAAYFARQAAARAPAWQDPEDLLAFAHNGLLKAIQTYNPNAGAKFETWATRIIPRRIADGQRSEDPLKRPERALVKLMQGARDKLWDQYQRTPTVQQLADEMRVTIEDARRAQLLEKSVTSDLEDVHPPEHDEHEVVVKMAEIRSHLALRLASLDDRGRSFALAYYCDELNVTELSKSIGVSPDWARLTRSQVLEALAH